MTNNVTPSNNGADLFPAPSQNGNHLPIPKEIRAMEHVKRMRGGSQPQLMRCSDGRYYVVKFPNNPQGSRVLFNDLLGSRLAALLGLPVATATVVVVERRLIDLSAEMTIEHRRGRSPCQAGKCFGSRVPVDPRRSQVYDLMPFSEVGNPLDFLGMLVFDKWTCNADGRQVVFFRQGESPELTAVMIDQGFCFNSSEWNFPDSPLRGRYYLPRVYDSVNSMDRFEPWLSRLESEIDEKSILAAAEGIPAEWYESDANSLARLLERLNSRRCKVRELLWSAWKSDARLFPNWLAPSSPKGRAASA